ncbi:MAG TPA: cupin domain-containing protein [Chloroflexota bacterium]|nr:cupin domain-containing protein [Chloroflexota bacterium]
MRERAREVQTHYDIQMERRAADVDDWERNRKVMAYARNLRMSYSPLRNASYGTLIGPGGQCPSRVIDTRMIEIEPGARTSTHRHTHSAELFCLEGEGYTVVNDRRATWGKWDAVYIPTNTWHYTVNTGNTPARFVSISDAPLFDLFHLDSMDDIGQAEPRGPFFPDTELQRIARAVEGKSGEYEAAILAAAENERRLATGTLVTHFKEQTLLLNKKGTRSTFLVDISQGFHGTGLSMVMFQIAPGGWQSKHRHGGEAVLFCVDGKGYSVIDGERHEWAAGDATLVSKWSWHQHFNADPDNIAVIIRMHMWESQYKLMSFCLYPLPMYEEPARLDGSDPSLWERHSVEA